MPKLDHPPARVRRHSHRRYQQRSSNDAHGAGKNKRSEWSAATADHLTPPCSTSAAGAPRDDRILIVPSETRRSRSSGRNPLPGRSKSLMKNLCFLRSRPRSTFCRSRGDRRSSSSSDRIAASSRSSYVLLVLILGCLLRVDHELHHELSFSRTSSLTARASALPPSSFITWPTKKPSRPSLPPR